jgi:phosphoribosyl-AMP cyclohydrolase
LLAGCLYLTLKSGNPPQPGSNVASRCCILRAAQNSTSGLLNVMTDAPSKHAAEESLALAPKFDSDGLVTVVATDVWTGEVLMVAHMNEQALRRTVETGEAWYWSRSRRELWKKGESSGHTQRVTEMRVDCDQDAVWIKVEQHGPGACHTGRRSCFYREVPLRQVGAITLEFQDASRTFDPGETYGKPE